MSYQKTFLLGNVANQPVLEQTKTQKDYCVLVVYTNKTWTKDGAKHESSERHRILVWGNRAKAVAKYVYTGRMVHVEAELKTRKWQDAAGQDRYITELHAIDVTFLGAAKQVDNQLRDAADVPPAFDGDYDALIAKTS